MTPPSSRGTEPSGSHREATAAATGSRRVWRAVRSRLSGLLSARDRAVLAAGCLLLGLAAIDVRVGGPLTYVDRAVRSVASSTDRRDSWIDALGVLGAAGAAGAVLAIAALVAMQVLEKWWPGILAGALIGVVGLVVTTVKVVIGRDGPDGTAVAGGAVGYFPSGHTATAVVALGTAAFLATTAASHGRRIARAATVGRGVGLAAGCVVGATAVLTAHHWLTDVLASLVFAGAVLEVGLAAAARHVERPAGSPTE